MLSSNVILFGGTGFIGKELRNKLENKNISYLSPSRAEVELCSKESLKKYLFTFCLSSSAIVFAAAKTPYCTTPKDNFLTMRENLLMVENLVESISENSLNRIIYLSTIDVYKPTDEVITEQSLLEPRSYYAAFKIASEMLLKAACVKKNIPLFIARISQVYGINDNSPKFIPTAVHAALVAKSITLHNQGMIYRDFVHVEDVAEIIVKGILMETPVNDTINIVSGISYSLKQIATWIQEYLSDCKIDYAETDVPIINYYFNNQKLKMYFPHNFKTLKEELKKIIDKSRS